MQTQFSFTTRRAAEIAGVENHVLLTSLQRHGHWRGIEPIRLPNRQLRWPSVAVYQALGKIPPNGRAPADECREFVCQQTQADPFQVHQVCAELYSDKVKGNNPHERFAYASTRIKHGIAQIEALASLIRQTLDDEEALSDADIARFHALAADLDRANRLLTDPLRWRTAATPAPTLSLFDPSNRRPVGGKP